MSEDCIVLGTTNPEKEVTFEVYRNQVIAELIGTLDGCSTEADVLELIGDMADCIKNCWDDGDSVELAVDCIMDGLQGE